jgi:nanoRNase/pAp phosphatase (c-di-AMP/oligoRNAs hydrolase)
LVKLSCELFFALIGEVDVSLIAKSYGGGGHRNASGAMIATPVSFNTVKQLYSYPDVKIQK